jgi:hypothetical protein
LNILPVEGKPTFQYNRCAVVGNAQRALLAADGVTIDHYEAVLRLNQAPAGEMASKFVGGKTTMRLLNQVEPTPSLLTRAPGACAAPASMRMSTAELLRRSRVHTRRFGCRKVFG